jgi:hypothetical protein
MCRQLLPCSASTPAQQALYEIRTSKPVLDMDDKIISIIPVSTLLKKQVILMLNAGEDSPLEKN